MKLLQNITLTLLIFLAFDLCVSFSPNLRSDKISSFKSKHLCRLSYSPVQIQVRPVLHKLHSYPNDSNSNSGNYPSTKRNPKQRKGKGYEQVGEQLDYSTCPLTHDEIIQLLKDRTKARRAQNFQRADEILLHLKRNNVSVNDSTKQWRADGRSFVNFNKNERGTQGKNDDAMCVYTKERNSRSVTERDEEYIMGKLKERHVAKLNRDFDTADDIRDELRFLKNVEIDDSKRTFRVVDPFKLEYTFGGKRVNNINPDLLKEIELKIKDRSNAKKKKNFELADSLLKELTEIHKVRVDDAKKEWHFMRKKGGEIERMEKSKRKNEMKRLKKQNKKDHDKNDESDWSVIEHTTHELIPGISLVDDDAEVETNPHDLIPGISLSDDFAEALEDKTTNAIPIPDGIVFDEEEDATQKDTSQGAINVGKSVLESLTVPILKQKLRDAGLPVSGRKMELVERLLNAN